MIDDGTKASDMSNQVPAAIPRQAPAVRHEGAVAVGAVATGALVLGAVAMGAVAIGALAVGKLAIGQLALGRARLRNAQADELRITRLIIGELRIERGPRATADRLALFTRPVHTHPDKQVRRV